MFWIPFTYTVSVLFWTVAPQLLPGFFKACFLEGSPRWIDFSFFNGGWFVHITTVSKTKYCILTNGLDKVLCVLPPRAIRNSVKLISELMTLLNVPQSRRRSAKSTDFFCGRDLSGRDFLKLPARNGGGGDICIMRCIWVLQPQEIECTMNPNLFHADKHDVTTVRLEICWTYPLPRSFAGSNRLLLPSWFALKCTVLPKTWTKTVARSPTISCLNFYTERFNFSQTLLPRLALSLIQPT